METNVSNKRINDIEEFTKLFKVTIPVESEFEYYIDTLKQSKEYSNKLTANLSLYLSLEEFVEKNGYKSVREYKKKCLDTLKDYILSTNAYANLLSAPLPTQKLETKTLINSVEPHQYLVSLDFKSANYSALKMFQNPGEDELGTDWEDLCSRFNIHECLVKSKSFRQIVFGNTNPKRLQTFQHVQTLKLVEHLKKELNFVEEDFVFISHDEVILKVEKASTVQNKLKINLDKMLDNVIKMPLGLTIFTLEKIKKDTFVKTIYHLDIFTPSIGSRGFIDTAAGRWVFEEDYKTLHGIASHKFYMYFKKHILAKPIDERDLMFKIDGELAKWII